MCLSRNQVNDGVEIEGRGVESNGVMELKMKVGESKVVDRCSLKVDQWSQWSCWSKSSGGMEFESGGGVVESVIGVIELKVKVVESKVME